MATENIRQAARYKTKIIEQGERIQELERIRAEQAAQIRKMTPADEKRKATQRALDETQARWVERLNEANGTIRELHTRLQRGQKGVINDVISDLQARYRGMPNPLPSDAEEPGV
jgi:hypothetical protein